MYTIYGIPNCNTVKKALDWLKLHEIKYEFHDYKKKGISNSKLQEWKKQVGIDALINKKGTTWRQLDEATQASIKSEKSAIDLMTNKTSVIKRPLIENGNKVVMLGYDEYAYNTLFTKK